MVCILFPELEKLVPSLHLASVYALLEEFPGAKQVASAHLTRLKALLETASKGRYKRDMALKIRDAAGNSIGSWMPAKSLELQHTIRLIRELDAEIAEIEGQIQAIMDELHSPITTIPGLGFRMAAMILAEVGDFTRFDSPDKLLAYAGMSPSTYQSGQLKNCYPHMESAVPGICAMPFTMQPNMSVTGTRLLLIILPRNGLRGNTTTSHFPMLQKNWCV